MKTNIAVFFGCRSVEHEVSIISAVQAMHAINREKYDVTPVYVAKDGTMYSGENLFEIENFRDMKTLKDNAKKVTFLREGSGVVMHTLSQKRFKKIPDVAVDLAFPIVHGTNCEDGTMAGYFEFLGLPYISCDIISAAVGMDKAVFKDVLKAASLPVLDCIRFRAREYTLNKQAITNKIKAEVGFPLIVKPINLGSSVGITKVNQESELDDAIRLGISYSDAILVEKAISNLREINCSVLGDSDECEASVCEEPFMNDEILSYEDKYMGGAKGEASKGMASLGRKIPADISEEKSNEIRELSCKIFKAIGANGVVRIDFLLDTETDKVYANEINTIPGSLAFYLWEATGIKYTEMIDKLVEIAFRRQRNRDNLTFTIDTNILSGVSFGTKGAKGAKF
ncbi:MAG: D-alanine--D-alanine ligase family protein [Clostridia bacterium]|nr:D-alanine--D-alanine ligase family protein [Clostridia bacterium]